MMSLYTRDDNADFRDFDYWDAYDEYADLNFSGSSDGEGIMCHAYPVVNGIPDYSESVSVFVGYIKVTLINEDSSIPELAN